MAHCNAKLAASQKPDHNITSVPSQWFANLALILSSLTPGQEQVLEQISQYNDDPGDIPVGHSPDD